MTDTRCKLCQQGVGSVNSTPTEASRRYGVSRSSVRRHMAHSNVETHDEGNTLIVKDIKKARSSSELAKLPQHENGIILSQTDSEWESVNGEGETIVLHSSKITTVPDLTNNASVKRMVEDAKRRIWEPVNSHSVHEVPVSGQPAPILLISDPQLGKGNQRGGGTTETLQLLNKAFEEFCSGLDYAEEAAIIDVGDIIEGFSNFNGQREQNDLDLVSQIEIAFNFMLKSVSKAAQLVNTLYYVSVPSNHCEVRAGKKDQIGSSSNDYGLLINRMVEDTLSDVYNNIKFIRPVNNYLQAEFTISNTNICVFHGHNVGNINTHAKWWKDLSFNRKPGWDSTILFTGHFHSMRFEEVDAGRWIIHCPTSESGSDSFENSKGACGTRSVLSIDVQNGMWYDPYICTMES